MTGHRLPRWLAALALIGLTAPEILAGPIFGRGCGHVREPYAAALYPRAAYWTPLIYFSGYMCHRPAYFQYAPLIHPPTPGAYSVTPLAAVEENTANTHTNTQTTPAPPARR